MTEREASDWPGLFSLVEKKVKPRREEANRESHRRRWWQYGEVRPGLVRALQGKERVLVCSQTSKYLALAMLPSGWIYSEKLKVFTMEGYGAFCILQSRVHELWALFFGSTMKDDPVYTPSDCYETFPFPDNWELRGELVDAGRAYYEFRAGLMVARSEGLTGTYNRFHNPDETTKRSAG